MAKGTNPFAKTDAKAKKGKTPAKGNPFAKKAGATPSSGKGKPAMDPAKIASMVSSLK